MQSRFNRPPKAIERVYRAKRTWRAYSERYVRISILILASTIPFLWYRNHYSSIVYGISTAVIVALISWLWTPSWRHIRPLLYTLAGIGLWFMLEIQPPWLVHKTYIWSILIQEPDKEEFGLMHTLVPFFLSLALAIVTYRTVKDLDTSATKGTHKRLIGRLLIHLKNWLKSLLHKIWKMRNGAWDISIAVLVLLIPITVYVVFGLLQHAAFGTFAWDAAIFEQAIYLLSEGQLPASSVRQISNLFFDHQHMAIVVLAPLYWITDGWNGYLLQLVSIGLIFLIPALVTWRAGITIVRSLVSNQSIKNQRVIFAILLVAITATYAWHPGAMGAVRFSFHPIYIAIPCMAVLTWLSARLIVRKQPIPHTPEAIIAVCMAVIWTFSKEDQWIFVLAFFVQILIGIPLLRAIFRRYSTSFRSYLNQQHTSPTARIRAILFGSTLAIAGIVYPLIHAQHVLDIYQLPTHTYTFLIEDKLNNTADQLKQGNVRSATEELRLFAPAATVSYQHVASFNAIGLAGLPLSVIGWHAERLVLGVPRIISLFHYGAGEPFHSSVGVIVLCAIILIKKRSVRIIRYATTAYGMFLWMGIAAFTGMTVTGPLFLDLELIQEYRNTASLRTFMKEAHSHINPNDSVMADETLLPHFAARSDAGLFNRRLFVGPAVLDPDSSIYNAPFDTIDKTDYEWWVLRLDAHDRLRLNTGVYTYLKEGGYEIVFQNESGAILHNPTCDALNINDCQPTQQ